MGKQWKQCLTLFLGAPKSLQWDCNHEIKRHFLLGWKVVTNLDIKLKSRDITLPTKVHLIKAMRFGLWRKLSAKKLMLSNCGLEKILGSPLDSKEIQAVHPKRNKSWIFIGNTDVEAEAPILWLPDAKSWFIWDDPDAGKDWRHEKKGITEDEMVGWHHRLNGHEFE